MKNTLFKSKKILALAVGVVIFVGIAGLYFNSQKLPTYKITIKPTELSPHVSREQARTNACSEMKGNLFDDICKKKYDKVGRNDADKVRELFLLLKKIEDDTEISDYERLLLSQATFASLPTKNSPLAYRSGYLAILSNFEDFVSEKNIAYAAESSNNLGIGEDQFKKMMAEDLKKAVGSIPKGDNAWAISVVVSAHEWINGERQPIYSEEYAELFDPYPGVSTEDKSGLEQSDLVHMHSRVGSYATSQNMLTGTIGESTGKLIGYSVSIMSWRSKPYGTDSELVVAEAGPPEQYLASEYHFTEEGYQGDDLLSSLLSAVEMPSRKQPTKDKQETDSLCGEYTPGTTIARDEIKCISGKPGCEVWVDDTLSGLYCFDSIEELDSLVGDKTSEDGFKLEITTALRTQTPTYPYTDALEIEGPPANFPGTLE